MSETDEYVWHLVIEDCGVGGDREYHRSLHVSRESARNKAERILDYDVPALDKWYVRPPSNSDDTQYIGYVLERDEIDRWPIRIQANKEPVLDDGGD